MAPDFQRKCGLPFSEFGKALIVYPAVAVFNAFHTTAQETFPPRLGECFTLIFFSESVGLHVRSGWQPQRVSFFKFSRERPIKSQTCRRPKRCRPSGEKFPASQSTPLKAQDISLAATVWPRSTLRRPWPRPRSSGETASRPSCKCAPSASSPSTAPTKCRRTPKDASTAWPSAPIPVAPSTSGNTSTTRCTATENSPLKNGAVYVGEHQHDNTHGRGKYTFADGDFDLGFYVDDCKDSGEGVRFSKDRQKAWLLKDGEIAQELSRSEAAKKVEELGLSELLK